MSVAVPKSQAKEPIQLDVILVCKKRGQDTRIPLDASDALANTAERARQKLVRLASMGLKLSGNDCRVIVFSQFISTLGPLPSAKDAVHALLDQKTRLEELAESLCGIASVIERSKSVEETCESRQISLIRDANSMKSTGLLII